MRALWSPAHRICSVELRALLTDPLLVLRGLQRRHAVSPRDLLQAVSELEHSVDRHRRLLTTPPAELQQLRTAPDARTEDQRVRDKVSSHSR